MTISTTNKVPELPQDEKEKLWKWCHSQQGIEYPNRVFTLLTDCRITCDFLFGNREDAMKIINGVNNSRLLSNRMSLVELEKLKNAINKIPKLAESAIM